MKTSTSILKTMVATILIAVLYVSSSAQDLPFAISVEPVNFPAFPGIQSFVAGHHDGKWVFIGGRTDGLHQRQPFAAFQPDGNNTTITVADFDEKQIWQRSVNELSINLQEQLQSTNMEFVQRDTVLYLIGGYGYSAELDEWITHPFLTAVDLPGVINAVINGGDLAPHFRQLGDERMMVTGGQLGLLNDRFYLVGGQLFEGRYNPMGPQHGPGFLQEYTNAIRSFEVLDDGTSLTIQDYQETVDSLNLHRRDYNLAPQVFPNGTQGFTVFSGVFQYDVDLPWLNSVDVDEAGYSVNDSFQQFLSNYHSAKLPVYSAVQNSMHTVFFGGISRYYLDANGNLVDDPDVPFVKTISVVSRFADGTMTESKIGDLEAYLGAGAEFLPVEDLPIYSGHGVVDLDNIGLGKRLAGYLVGGIESSQPNIFFINTGTQSQASPKIFKVFIEAVPTSAEVIDGEEFFGLEVAPNPATEQLTVSFGLPLAGQVRLSVFDVNGKLSLTENHKLSSGKYEMRLELDALPTGTYSLVLTSGKFQTARQFVKN